MDAGDQDIGLAPTKFSGEHDATAWELIVTDPQRAHWGDFCGWSLPRADQVLQPIMLRPGGGGHPGKLHGLAGSGVEHIRIVFADGSTTMASTVSLGPARVDALGYIVFFEAGEIPSAIVGTGPSGDVVDKVQAPDRYADDPLPSG